MRKSLNDITAADQEEIKNFASLFFSPREIALVMELDVTPFITACDQEGHFCFNAFYAGRLKSESELRQSVVTLAKSGSSPAQTMAMEMLSKSTIKMMDK